MCLCLYNRTTTSLPFSINTKKTTRFFIILRIKVKQLQQKLNIKMKEVTVTELKHKQEE